MAYPPKEFDNSNHFATPHEIAPAQNEPFQNTRKQPARPHRVTPLHIT